MGRVGLTDAEVELEIAELLQDKDVKLAKAEKRIIYRRRQYLYGLRGMKARGQALRNDPEYAWLVEEFENECED